MEIEKRNMLGYDESNLIKVNVKGTLDGFGEKTSDRIQNQFLMK